MLVSPGVSFLSTCWLVYSASRTFQDEPPSKLQQELWENIYKAWARRKALLGQLQKLEDEVHKLNDTSGTPAVASTSGGAGMSTSNEVQSSPVSSASSLQPLLPSTRPPLAPGAQGQVQAQAQAQAQAKTTLISSARGPQPQAFVPAQAPLPAVAQPSLAMSRVQTTTKASGAEKKARYGKSSNKRSVAKSINNTKNESPVQVNAPVAGFSTHGTQSLLSSSNAASSSTPGSSAFTNKFASGVSSMLSVAQNGLSCVAPLSPVTCAEPSAPASCERAVSSPLTSLAQSTQKFLTSFAAPAAQPPLAAAPPPKPGPMDTSGIRLLCDLLNGTLPEYVPAPAQPPIMSTNSGQSLLLGSSGVVNRVHPLPSVASSASGCASVPGTTLTHTQGPVAPTGCAGLGAQGLCVPAVSAGSTTSGNTPQAQPQPGEKVRLSPFSIDSIVSSSGKSRVTSSPRQTGSPPQSRGVHADSAKRTSPQSASKSPKNFSIAHLTRIADGPNSTEANAKLVPDSGRTAGPTVEPPDQLSGVASLANATHISGSGGQMRNNPPKAVITAVVGSTADKHATRPLTNRKVAPASAGSGSLADSRTGSPEKGTKIAEAAGSRSSPRVTSTGSPVGGAVSSSQSPSRVSELDLMNFSLSMIPLPTGERPRSRTGSAGSPNADAEVSGLMVGGALPQSPSISSSELKPGPSDVGESRAPALVDSNPNSARSPIPVPSSAALQIGPSISLPSFHSVFSLSPAPSKRWEKWLNLWVIALSPIWNQCEWDQEIRCQNQLKF